MPDVGEFRTGTEWGKVWVGQKPGEDAGPSHYLFCFVFHFVTPVRMEELVFALIYSFTRLSSLTVSFPFLSCIYFFSVNFLFHFFSETYCATVLPLVFLFLSFFLFLFHCKKTFLLLL